jgi:hypothetical protein
MKLIELSYVSRATQKMNEIEFINFLGEIRYLNKKNNLTGVISFKNSGIFGHLIEGFESVVVPLFEKIKSDPRHTDVMLIHQAYILERNYSKYPVKFIGDVDVVFNEFEEEEDYLDISPGLPKYLGQAMIELSRKTLIT